MKRGCVKKQDSRLINFWMPEEVLPLMDKAVGVEDSDRSKFIRNAVREKIARTMAEKGQAA